MLSGFLSLEALFEGRPFMLICNQACMEGYVISKDEVVHKELGDRIERAATTASSLEAEQVVVPGAKIPYWGMWIVKLGLRLHLNSLMIHLSQEVTYLEVGRTSIQSSTLLVFWATTKVQMVNGVRQLQPLVDKKRVIITESSIRSDLHLDDAEGTDCLPTATIFEELARMGTKSTTWNEFSSTMASLIICLATNQKFNMSKYIFNAMVKHLDGGVKFLMYLRFLQVFINQQLGDMSHHKKIFVNPFHTKKVFANMKRAGKDFSGRITPLFDTMMVQASEEVGEDSDHPTDSNQIPIVDQPSTSSQPKQKQKSKRRQRKEAEVPQDETEHEESVSTPSNDPQPSGEDSMQLNDLMVLCTKLQAHILDLEKAKDAQAKEIAALKKRVQKLERKKTSRTTGLQRLKKVGITRRVESCEDQESLGDHEDASKQGRSIEDINADVEIPVEAKIDEKNEQSTKLDDSTAGEAVTTTSVEDSVAPTIPTTVEETLAQTLMEIKAAKPKAKGIVLHDQEEQVFVSKSTVSVTQPSVKDKGKAQLEAEIIEKEKLARKQEEEANIALIESWDDTQAMMEADFELTQRLQTKEQGEITIEERSRLFVELMNKRKKHFAMLRAEEKKRKPPTKAQKRNQMSTYLKNMGRYKHNQLKSKSFEEIQKMFANEIRRVNTFIPMDSEVVKCKKEIEESSKRTEDELESDKLKKAEGSEEKTKGSRKKMLGRKRAGKEQQQESSKKQRLKEDKESDEVEEVEEDDEDALKKYLIIKKDDDIAIDVIPLATKLPMIGIDKEDLQTLWKLFRTKHDDIRPEDEHERVLWEDLKVMFEPYVKSDVWRNLQGYKIQKMNIKFRGGLLGLKRLQGFLRLLLLSAAGEKITTADYNCLKTFYCQEDKDGLKR
ncbi:hypothetical protein Tco_0164146 [Tanacetum coccineum]